MSRKSTRTMSAVSTVNAPEFQGEGTLIQDLIVWEPYTSDLGLLCVYPLPYQPAEGTYHVVRPTKAVTQRDNNDLGRAVTLILQLLPLTDTTYRKDDTLTQEESTAIQQLLLEAAYKLETIAATPIQRCKVAQA